MLTSGDVVDLDLGHPRGREAGYRHPAIIVTAQVTLDQSPPVIQVVPATSTLRRYASEVEIAPDRSNGLDVESAAQCQHIRGISPERILHVRGNVGPVALAQVRDRIADLLDLPA